MLRRAFVASTVRAFATANASASAATAGTRKKFDPKKILPHEFGHVRVINNTTRDAQQVGVELPWFSVYPSAKPNHMIGSCQWSDEGCAFPSCWNISELCGCFLTASVPLLYRLTRILITPTHSQANCSAEMSHEHRVQITKLIDACYKPTTVSGQAPGYEQIWGGTVPMFDIWKRGVSPFDSLREQVWNLSLLLCVNMISAPLYL
jgi:hypothetical protein